MIDARTKTVKHGSLALCGDCGALLLTAELLPPTATGGESDVLPLAA